MSITWKQVMSLVKNNSEPGKLTMVFSSDKTCLRPAIYGRVIEIHLAKGAKPEEALHELCHFILLDKGLSPWCKLPGWVLEGWRDGRLRSDWQQVAEEANRVDHMMVDKLMAKLIQSLE